ncbi:BPL-N domain-containing protein [Pseudonocardia charpentierae]|uniref:BPL-N domain-containing protein n=1 Tax=Pseudonocardia charpentierae TaxID=3075545 RepID=A0ABU2ND86_9PSEU|nr:BPL-N domain-containing protein [Pseudonocardia sp. DSM 45834]MDT0351239.1 BPL-N domain-containing protein [Pseudonocardia sp. DSM 45834]
MRPLALVYRGPAARPTACTEAVADLLRSSPLGFEVRYVGRGEKLRPATLSRAVLYAQPGGGTLRAAYCLMRRHRATIRDYVAAGGRYLGFCLGGYLAGATPGFDLLPGDTDQYVATPGATVRGTGDVIIDVDWRGHRRQLFFQDGPVFVPAPGATGATVLARYPNGGIAALVAPFGAGRVGVVGPHPEATADWYHDAGLRAPSRLPTDLGHDLIDEVMA